MTQARTITAIFGEGVLPIISVTPASQDFGSILVGITADRAFTVQNVGGGTLTGTASVSAAFAVVSNGTYNLAAGASQTVTVRYTPTAAGSHSTNVVFTGGNGASRQVTGAATASAIISGTVTRSDTKAGMGGVTITFSSVGSVISDGSGNYTMPVPLNWAGTAMTSFTNGGFAKPTLTFKAVKKNQTKKNFVWSPDPVISGTVTRSDTKAGAAGVTITANNGGGTTTTASSGTYSLTVPYNWTGVVTPSAGGGTFKPVSKSFSNLTKNKANQKFVWTAPAGSIVSQSAPNSSTTTAADTAVPAPGFAQWALMHGLTGNPADLFGQVAGGDGITYGAQYTFGANLAKGEPLMRLLLVNGKLTAEVPMQDPATLLDARETVEFTCDKESIFWFPAVCLPPLAPTPPAKQWFQAGYGDAVDFRVTVELVK